MKGLFYGKDILDTLRLPYKMFGHDTSMILVLEYARRLDEWWRREGRGEWAGARAAEAAGRAR